MRPNQRAVAAQQPHTIVQESDTELDELSQQIENGEKPASEMMDILGNLGITPGDDNYSFTVCHVLGAARNGVKEPQILEGDTSIIEGLQKRLRDSFREGRFRIRIFKNKRLVARKDIEVSSLPDASAAAPLPTDLGAVLTAALEKQNDRMMQMIEKIQERTFTPAAPAMVQIDPFSMFEKCATIFANLKGRDSGGSSIELVMNAFNKGIEISKNLRGGGEETGLFDLVKSAIESPALAEMVGQVIENHRSQQPGQQRRPVNGARVQPVPQQPSQTPQPQPQPAPALATPDYAAQLNTVLIERLNYLIAKANANANPALYAEWTIDNVPPDLARMVIVPGFLDQVSAQLPQVAAHKEWFAEMIAEMTDMMQGAEPEADTGQNLPEGGEGADIADAGVGAQ